jgi:ribosomal protein L11 methyltransferase
MIRLAVRCRPELAEAVLADLAALAPNGVEEDEGPGYVEYAIYGGEGELPELGDVRATAGEGLIDITSTEIPDDWADRWKDFHRAIEIEGRLRVRPSWEPASESAGMTELVIDPGQAFGTGAHATTRMCLELLLGLAGEPGGTDGGATDLGTGSGVLAIAAAKLGWSPVEGFDHEDAAVAAAKANAEANAVEAAFERVNLRETIPPMRETAVANLTARLLGELAPRLGPQPVRRLVLSGMLATEADTVAASFLDAGFAEAKRLTDGDWVALGLEKDG